MCADGHHPSALRDERLPAQLAEVPLGDGGAGCSSPASTLFVSSYSLLGVRFLLFALGDERTAAPPPSRIWRCAWAFEEGGSTASRWTPLPRPARQTGQGSRGVMEVGRRRGGGK